MEVLIDTSFILGCLDKKIPLFDDLEDMGLKVLIPDQVVGELKKLTAFFDSVHFKKPKDK